MQEAAEVYRRINLSSTMASGSNAKDSGWDKGEAAKREVRVLTTLSRSGVPWTEIESKLFAIYSVEERKIRCYALLQLAHTQQRIVDKKVELVFDLRE